MNNPQKVKYEELAITLSDITNLVSKLIPVVANQISGIPVEKVNDELSNAYSNICCMLMNYPDMPVEVLTELADYPDSAIRVGVACHKNTLPSVLRKLARDVNRDVREYVAGNPNTPIDALKELSNDSDEMICHVVMNNPSTPVELVWKLLCVQARGYDFELTGGPEDLIDTLVTFSKNSDWRFRYLAAGSPYTPPDVLAELVEDEDFRVQTAADGNPSTPDEW